MALPRPFTLEPTSVVLILVGLTDPLPGAGFTPVLLADPSCLGQEAVRQIEDAFAQQSRTVGAAGTIIPTTPPGAERAILLVGLGPDYSEIRSIRRAGELIASWLLKHGQLLETCVLVNPRAVRHQKIASDLLLAILRCVGDQLGWRNLPIAPRILLPCREALTPAAAYGMETVLRYAVPIRAVLWYASRARDLTGRVTSNPRQTLGRLGDRLIGRVAERTGWTRDSPHAPSDESSCSLQDLLLAVLGGVRRHPHLRRESQWDQPSGH